MRNVYNPIGVIRYSKKLYKKAESTIRNHIEGIDFAGGRSFDYTWRKQEKNHDVVNNFGLSGRPS